MNKTLPEDVDNGFNASAAPNASALAVTSPQGRSFSSSASRAASNPLASKISTVLSSSYADLEIRQALHILDSRGVSNTPDTRRNLRLDVQREIIQSNADIVDDFGHVADVCAP